MASHVSLKNKPMGSIASHIHKLRYPTNTIKNDNFLNRKIWENPNLSKAKANSVQASTSTNKNSA